MGLVPWWHLDLQCKSFWFGKIWIPNVGDIYFEVICTTENSNKFHKTRFWKEKSAWECGNTWKAYHSIQAWFPFILGCSKNWSVHCKTMFTCWVFVFCNGFTLGPTAHATLVNIKFSKSLQ
jgi:hypothetical protein